MQDKDKVIKEKIDALANEVIVNATRQFGIVAATPEEAMKMFSCLQRVYRSGYAAGEAVSTRKGTGE